MPNAALLALSCPADHERSVIHAYLGLRHLYDAWRAPALTCPHCHGKVPLSNGAYAAVAEYDPAAEESAMNHSHDSKEFQSSHGRITLRGDESEASNSKDPRPSTDDETARL
jgi:hypothetical protein